MMGEERQVLDVLLEADISEVKTPTRKVKLKRLSEALDTDVIFTCTAVSPTKMDDIQEQSVRKGDDGEPDLDVTEMQIFTVLEGVKEPNLKSKELKEKYDALTPKELVRKMLLPGEITKLYNVISDLSGFGDEAVEEVKN